MFNTTVTSNQDLIHMVSTIREKLINSLLTQKYEQVVKSAVTLPSPLPNSQPVLQFIKGCMSLGLVLYQGEAHIASNSVFVDEDNLTLSIPRTIELYTTVLVGMTPKYGEYLQKHVNNTKRIYPYLYPQKLGNIHAKLLSEPMKFLHEVVGLGKLKSIEHYRNRNSKISNTLKEYVKHVLGMNTVGETLYRFILSTSSNIQSKRFLREIGEHNVVKMSLYTDMYTRLLGGTNWYRNSSNGVKEKVLSGFLKRNTIAKGMVATKWTANHMARLLNFAKSEEMKSLTFQQASNLKVSYPSINANRFDALSAHAPNHELNYAVKNGCTENNHSKSCGLLARLSPPNRNKLNSNLFLKLILGKIKGYYDSYTRTPGKLNTANIVKAAYCFSRAVMHDSGLHALMGEWMDKVFRPISVRMETLNAKSEYAKYVHGYNAAKHDTKVQLDSDLKALHVLLVEGMSGFRINMQKFHVPVISWVHNKGQVFGDCMDDALYDIYFTEDNERKVKWSNVQLYGTHYTPLSAINTSNDPNIRFMRCVFMCMFRHLHKPSRNSSPYVDAMTKNADALLTIYRAVQAHILEKVPTAQKARTIELMDQEVLTRHRTCEPQNEAVVKSRKRGRNL